MSRDEFSQATRKAAWKRANGICECGCGMPFDLNHPKGCPVYDHELPDFLGGANDLGNCKCIRLDCHNAKTVTEDLPRIKKVRRADKDRLNLKPTRRGFASNRNGRFKRKLDGTTEPRQ